MDAVQQAASSHTWAATPLTSRTNPRDCARQRAVHPRRPFSNPATCKAGPKAPCGHPHRLCGQAATRSWTHPAASSARITEQQRGDEQRGDRHAVEPWPASSTCAWRRAAAWRAPSPPPCRARTRRPWSAAVAAQIRVDLAGGVGQSRQPVEGVTHSCAGAEPRGARPWQKGCECDVAGRERVVGRAHLQPRLAAPLEAEDPVAGRRTRSRARRGRSRFPRSSWRRRGASRRQPATG